MSILERDLSRTWSEDAEEELRRICRDMREELAEAKRDRARLRQELARLKEALAAAGQDS